MLISTYLVKNVARPNGGMTVLDQDGCRSEEAGYRGFMDTSLDSYSGKDGLGTALIQRVMNAPEDTAIGSNFFILAYRAIDD